MFEIFQTRNAFVLSELVCPTVDQQVVQAIVESGNVTQCAPVGEAGRLEEPLTWLISLINIGHDRFNWQAGSDLLVNEGQETAAEPLVLGRLTDVDRDLSGEAVSWMRIEGFQTAPGHDIPAIIGHPKRVVIIEACQPFPPTFRRDQLNLIIDWQVDRFVEDCHDFVKVRRLGSPKDNCHFYHSFIC